MNEQPRVETVEEFKLRIAAIIRGTPEQITGAPRPHPLLVRRNKRATRPKTKHRRRRESARLMQVYEVRPRNDRRGVDLISDVLPFAALWYGGTERHYQRDRIRGAFQPLT